LCLARHEHDKCRLVPIVLPSCLGTAQHEKMPFVSCLGRHSGTARHDTNMPSCLIGPCCIVSCLVGLVSCLGQAAHLEVYRRGNSVVAVAGRCQPKA
jgi:hypothetical protein